MAGVIAATPSADSRAVIASLAVLPAFAVSHSAMRGLSAARELAFAFTQASTWAELAGGIGASALRM